ncbi:MAG: hypothetical protein ACQKBW_11135 [Puniceicoccales bacterium]
MRAFSLTTLLVLCCLASVAQAGARERLPFIPEVELRQELLPGENYSFAEQLQGGKEAWGKGFLQFQGVQEHDDSVSANIGVRSFLDGRFQVSLLPGDFFLAGNRYSRWRRSSAPSSAHSKAPTS